MSPAVVVIIATDAYVRERVASALAGAGFGVVGAASVREALDRLVLTGATPAAILLDPHVLRAEGRLWTAAQATNPQVAGVCVLLFEVEHPDRLPPEVADVRGVLPRHTPDRQLIAALSDLCAAAPRPRAARGTGRQTALGAGLDLHAFAEAKLVQYLGADRGAAILRALTADLDQRRIASTADLHRVANLLRARGELEAAVAALLSGRATLLDSNRTLLRDTSS